MLYSKNTDVEFSCGCAACQSAMQSPQNIETDINTVSTGSYSNALLLSSGLAWDTDKTGIELSYRFFDKLPGYYSEWDVESNNTQEFNSVMKAATERALNHIENFVNIDFVVSTESNKNTDLGFASATLSEGVGAHAYYPYDSPKAGDVWMNNLYSNTQNPEEGNYGFFVLLHEIGHALGLQHSFAVLSGEEATSQYSVMAYDWSPYFASSFMVYDIAALQNQYGANMNYNTGDDTYMIDKSLAYTIWDAGGNDTINTTDTRGDVIIDLNDGAYSSVGMTNNIGIAYNASIENVITGRGNDSVTGNETDNDIQTGDGNDIIYASMGSDIIDGGQGEDTIVYSFNISQIIISIIDSVTLTFQSLWSDAIDTLIRIETFLFDEISYSFNDVVQFASTADGNSPDIIASRNGEELYGDAGENYILGFSGNDKFYGGDGNDILNAGEGKNKLFGEGGDDVLTVGASGRNKLNGGVGHDTLTAAGKKNKLIGGEGDDTLNVDGKKNKLLGEDGEDTFNVTGKKNELYGDSDNDILSVLDGVKNKVYGGEGDDILAANGGKNKLIGGEGNDTLQGGPSDVLIGQEGRDVFAFTDISDETTLIKDFDIKEDRLDLSELLTGYNAIDEDIADFLMFTKENDRTIISVDQDGTGTASTFEAIVTSKVVIDLTANEAELANIIII